MKKKIFFATLVVMGVFCSALAQENKYTIQQYLNIRSASQPTFADKNGSRLFYLTNVSGTTQVWMIDANGAGAPKQITNYEDNVGFVSAAPDASGVVFGKAVGGNENTQFFWMSSDGTGIKQLTNSPTVRHNFGGWSHDGKKIYYASNKRDRNYFDIYAMDVSDGKEELIYQHNGNNDFAAVSKDGSRIIISRDSTELSLDNNLYLIDAKTKQETLLTPHTDAAEFGGVRFVSNNEIIFGTNDKREFINMARMNLDTKAVTMLDDTNWDTGAGAMSEDGSRLAYTINREGFSELYVTSPKDIGKKKEAVKLPAQGIVGGLDFSAGGGKLAFSFASSKYNSDVWVYDLKSKKLTQVTKSDRAGIPQESFVAPELIKFKSFDGREIPAWYYKPQSSLYMKGDSRNAGGSQQKMAGGLPVIISVHGGPESQERPGFNPLYQYYLSRGYAVLATNVRGSTGYGKTFTHLDDVEKREDSVKDLAAAVDWLKANGADAKRIAVMGGSYGGYMTMAAITLYPDTFAAAVNTVGIVNWETFLNNTSGYRRRQREVEYGRLDRDLDFLKKISPLAKVDRIKTPLFVIHGKNDPRVPYTEAEQVVEALRKRGAVVEYKLYTDEGHGISKLKNRLELYPLVADFLDKYMK
jgi:dipeptidyl aminopeptidase/acylaminoacyl peptidase